MCPACIATTAMLIVSAVSSGGATAVMVNKFRVKERAKRMLGGQNQKEKTWAQHTSK